MDDEECECRWSGDPRDPDATKILNKWCPVHGKDPDEEYERRRDDAMENDR
jgi:hypothetical protein